MPRSLMRRVLAYASVLTIAIASTAHAATFSFEGTFAEDDDLQFFTFTIGVATLVTVQTWSYGGGVNAAGDVIAPGGFDPILALFEGALDPNGLLIGLNNDGTCPPGNTDPGTGACWDSLLQSALVAGTYTIVLSESDNTPFGPFLSDGYSRSGQGNFTGPAFTGMPGAFIDANPSQRTNAWAVDILGVDQATAIGIASPVPSPATLTLLLSGLLAASTVRRLAGGRQ